MNIIEYAHQTIREYGKAGKNCFEYLGVDIRKDIPLNFKVYQKINEGNRDEFANNMTYSYILNSLLPDFIANNKICDYSESTYDGKKSYRIVFYIPKNQKIQETYCNIDKFFRNIDGGMKERVISNVVLATSIMKVKESPLMQIGIETDDKGNLFCVKYYIRLSGNIDKDAEFILKIAQSCVNKETIRDKIIFLQNHRYNPVFIGINMSEKIQETKLYFASEAFGFQTKNVIRDTNDIAEKYGFDDILTKQDIDELFNIGLFVRGIAFSIENEAAWRLYINALPRKKV